MSRIRSRLALAAALVLLSCLPLAAQRPAVTLEGLLSAPFPYELLASPTGGKLAWMQNARGVRNVWVAEPPEYRGRQITKYAADDGQALGGLEWMPDGKGLIYVRGGGAVCDLTVSMNEARIPRKRNYNCAAVRELVIGHADLKRASLLGLSR